MGAESAEKCDEFVWQPRGHIDPGSVADTLQHPKFGIGRAWSRSAGYSLAADPNLLYLVYTVEGGFEFEVDGTPVVAERESLILLDGGAPTQAQTLTETARFVWYFSPTFLDPRRSQFRFHEPIPMNNASSRALLSMTNSVLNASPPSTERAQRHLGLSLEHLIVGALEEAGADDHGKDSRHRDGLFMAAQLVIEAQFRDPAFAVSTLAKELCVSVRTLHDTFSRFGTTPRREIERRRIHEVDIVSSDTSLTSAEISTLSGFSSPKQMSRALARARQPLDDEVAA